MKSKYKEYEEYKVINAVYINETLIFSESQHLL